MGLKPNPVAKELGLSSATVTKWKNGTLPQSETLLKIADYFNVTTDYLLGKTPERSGDSSVIDLRNIEFALYGKIQDLTELQKEAIVNLASTFAKMNKEMSDIE